MNPTPAGRRRLTTMPALEAGEPASGWCQRWTGGTHSWRHRSEGGFDADRYGVVDLPEPLAQAFVLAHHYSRSWPNAKRRYGLIDLHPDAPTDAAAYAGGRLVGVAVLGIPMHDKVLTNPLPGLVPYHESLELSRLVLRDEVPANAESWFCAQMFRDAAAHGVRGLVAFSDPLPRWRATPTGPQLLMPGHVGVVYQALGAVYTGRGTARTLWLLPDGTSVIARSAAKITGGERGGNGLITRLVARGAAAPAPGEHPADWLAGALRQLGARTAAHPGNHRYVFRLGRTQAERSRVTIAMPARPYPKRDRQPVQLTIDHAA
ncbi:Mom family adenine methylcarbamoylation protein [Catenuloplanes atrovinosus]|uniref:Uncharacterized protein n=1 Tax=Catenuloplanes atrovinosus TaxID=137266 RepID=A0AAE4CC43_9ACTN|nr:hypothetical protein [Catenuloplanes atrovinosus]MDR7277589.1 hypothetical protein [Catenuloplanes atrovinosus]